MKTYDEWVSLVKDEELKQKLIDANKFLFEGADLLCYSSIHHAIGGGFVWEDTKQGYEYWMNIHLRGIELIPEEPALPQSSDELKQFIKDTVEAFYPQLKK